MKVSYHLIIKGKVQVGYRDWMRSQAYQLGIVGWVRNLGNGDVEARIEGAPENVNKIIQSCYNGPFRAQVSSLEKIAEAALNFSQFEIR